MGFFDRVSKLSPMVKPNETATAVSSVTRTLELIGDSWTLLIIRDAFLGVTRFDEFQRHLGVARNVLSARIKRLVDAEIMQRSIYVQRPARYEYLLTQRGKDLLPVIVTLRQWGDKWLCQDNQPLFTVSHSGCGGTPTGAIRCEKCDATVTSVDQIAWVVNRGAPGTNTADGAIRHL